MESVSTLPKRLLVPILLAALLAARALWKAYKWRTVQLNFEGVCVFVSGGSSGIGEELAKQLIRYNARKVIIAARRIEELQRVKEECAQICGDPDRVMVFVLDQSKPQEVYEKCKSLFEREHVDVVINNGGIS